MRWAGLPLEWRSHALVCLSWSRLWPQVGVTQRELTAPIGLADSGLELDSFSEHHILALAFLLAVAVAVALLLAFWLTIVVALALIHLAFWLTLVLALVALCCFAWRTADIGG